MHILMFVIVKAYDSKYHSNANYGLCSQYNVTHARVRELSIVMHMLMAVIVRTCGTRWQSEVNSGTVRVRIL